MTEKILARIPRADDLELHVKLTEIAGEKFLNLREYVVSRNWYGRGCVIPMTEADLSLLLGGIYAAADEAGLVVGL